MSFHFHDVSIVANWFCLVLLHISSARVCSLWRRVWALGLAMFSFVFSLILFSFSFTHFLLLTLYIFPCFFSSSFFILVFTPILLYKRIWAFAGQIVFTTKASTTVFGLLWTSLQGCPPIHWLPNHYHYWVNSIHSLPLLIPWQNLSLFDLAISLSLLTWMDKDLGLSLPTSMTCIGWSQL